MTREQSPHGAEEHPALSQQTIEAVEDGHLALLVEAALQERPTWEPPFCAGFRNAKGVADILQDDLVHRVDFGWYYDIFQWVETTLAGHFKSRRRPMDIAEPDKGEHACGQGQSTTHKEMKVSYSYTHVERALPGTAATHYILYAYAGH